MTLAIQRFDRTAALHTGRVSINDAAVMYVPAPTSVAGLMRGVFDAAEMPLGHYVFLKDIGAPFTAIPVFPDRLFIQQYVYTRADSGIRSPQDLRGRRVMVPQYYMTASIWHRGMLKDNYGIRPEEIQWHVSSPERDDRMRIPDGIPVVLSPCSHWSAEKLLDGTVDCLMHEGAPVIAGGDVKKLVCVYPDVDSMQRDFYRKTGFHIAVHVIAARAEAIKERPELLEELCDGFDQAKECAYRILQNERMTSLPLMRSYLDETLELFGEDPWSYGFEANRKELEQLLAYAHDQGLTRQRLAPEILFDPPARNFRFRAKLPYNSEPGSVLQF
jgi:4,5-dihydroxyphthalate decarboxylase